MTAPILTHRARNAPPADRYEGMALMARETLRRQTIEALPRVEGQLWERLREANSGSTTQST